MIDYIAVSWGFTDVRGVPRHQVLDTCARASKPSKWQKKFTPGPMAQCESALALAVHVALKMGTPAKWPFIWKMTK